MRTRSRSRSAATFAALFCLATIAATPGATAQQRRSLCVHGLDASKALNVRSGPGLEHPRIGSFPAKACDLRLTGKCAGTWCPMTLGTISGWVDTRHIGVYDLPADKAVAQQVETPAATELPDGKLPAADPAPPLASAPRPSKVVHKPPPRPKARAPLTASTRPVEPRPLRSQPIEQQQPRLPQPSFLQTAIRSLLGLGSPATPRYALGAVALARTEPRTCVTRVERWDTLRIRNGPGTGHDAIGEIPSQACGVGLVGGCQGRWCRVAWRGQAGWVNSYYLE